MSRTLLLAALLVATSTPVLAQAATSTLPEVEQLVDRLVRNMYGPNSNNQVTYGAVPTALPIKLDPRLSIIAGIRSNSGQNVQNRILLTTALPPEQALAVLGQSLKATGWEVRPQYNALFGFASPQTVRSATFYRAGETNFVLDAALTEQSGTTELDLNINVVPSQAIESFRKTSPVILHSSLPLLKAFPEADIKGTYPATFANGSLSTAQVKTDRSVNEVLSFYSAQLKMAGWKARTDTSNGPLRVVTYSLKDLNGREALGTLGIRPWEKEGGGYVLTVSVQGFKPW